MADVSRFPQGVWIDSAGLAAARPVGAIVHDTATGVLNRSTNAVAATYTALGQPGVIFDTQTQSWGTGVDVTYTAGVGGDSVTVGQGAGVGNVRYLDLLPVQWGTDTDVVMTSDGADLNISQGAGLGGLTFLDTMPVNFGTGKDLIITPDGTNVVFSNTAAALALWHDDVFTLADPADTTKRARFDAGPVTAAALRVTTLQDISLVTEGRVSASIADSTVLTSLAVPTLFDVTSVIAANTCKAGTTLRITAICRSASVNAGDLLSYTLQINDGGGADNLVASTPLNVGLNNRVLLEGTISFRAAPGAAVAGSGYFGSQDLSVGAETSGPAAGVVLTYATNAALTVQVLCTHNANNAGNQSFLEKLVIEIL